MLGPHSAQGKILIQIGGKYHPSLEIMTKRFLMKSLTRRSLPGPSGHQMGPKGRSTAYTENPLRLNLQLVIEEF